MPDPVYKLPDDWTGLKICLMWSGGVGDILMAIGGSTSFLKTRPCHITAAVRDVFVGLMQEVEGIDEVIPRQRVNDAGVRSSLDVIIDYDYSLTNSQELTNVEYYEAISNHAGFPVTPGRFKFQTERQKSTISNVFIHPNASNPNRRWSTKHWEETAWQIRDRGCNVFWLGTKDEFGFDADNITKLSNTSESLTYQIKKMHDHCDMFVGNDSGFAHVAGMLGIPGHVLFFNTAADVVIGSYPSLQGIDVYDTLKVEPSRMLRTDDPVAEQCMAAITPGLVMMRTGLIYKEKREMERSKISAKKLQIAVIGTTPHTDVTASFLAQYYDVELIEEIDNNTSQNFDVLLKFSDEKLTATSFADGAEVMVNPTHPEIVRAAVREVTLRASNCRSHDNV